MAKDGSKNVLVRSTVIACIVAAPSLSVFVALYFILDDPIMAGIAGGVVHFIALGFSFKIHKRLFGRSRP